MAWANPSTEDRLPDALFERHEQGTGEVARRLGFSVRAPCPRASRPALEERLPAERPTAIVSLVAHGDAAGGAVWLHDQDHRRSRHVPHRACLGRSCAPGVGRMGAARAAEP